MHIPVALERHDDAKMCGWLRRSRECCRTVSLCLERFSCFYNLDQISCWGLLVENLWFLTNFTEDETVLQVTEGVQEQLGEKSAIGRNVAEIKFSHFCPSSIGTIIPKMHHLTLKGRSKIRVSDFLHKWRSIEIYNKQCLVLSICKNSWCSLFIIQIGLFCWLTSWITLRVRIKASSVEISSHRAVCWLLQAGEI